MEECFTHQLIPKSKKYELFVCFVNFATNKLVLRPVYTERDHERERSVSIGLRISNLYESLYSKGDHERGLEIGSCRKS